MGEPVVLVLKANNSDHVRKMKEAQRATQAVYDEAAKGSTRSRSLIEKEIQIQKQLSEQRNKAKDLDNLKIYNRLLEQSKQRLSELEKAGLEHNTKIQKSTDSTVIPSLMRMAAAYVSVRTVVTALKDTALAFWTKSQEGADILERKTNGVKAAMAVLRGEFINAGKDFSDSFGDKKESGAAKILKFMNNAAKDFFNLMTGGTAKLVSDKTGLTAYFKDLKTRMGDAFEAADAWTKKQQELEDLENAMIVPRARANLQLKEARDKYAEGSGTIIERIELLQKANDLEAKTTEDELKFQQQKIDLLKTITDEKKKVGQLQREDERAYQEALAKQLELQAESFARTLRTTAAIKALLNQLKEENKASKIGGLTTTQDVIIGEDFNKDMSKRLEEWSKAKAHINEVIAADNKKRTDAEKKDWEERVSAVRDAVGKMEQFLGQLLDAQYENAQRNRELLDTKISELEEELQTETELFKAGYASNVNAKKVELQRMKDLRDKALLEENDALKKKRTMEAISQGLDIASAIMSIISKTFKNSKTWWQALISAGIGVGAMFALISSSKKQIAGATQLAAGGSGTDTGIITGRSHAQGGERFLNHVEVEHGEAWGVLSVPATKKFGKVFHHMVSSFNKGQIPVITPAAKVDNNVLVDNSGSNSRLDTLIKQNEKLTTELSKASFRDLGDRIVITRGNTVRTIRK